MAGTQHVRQQSPGTVLCFANSFQTSGKELSILTYFLALGKGFSIVPWFYIVKVKFISMVPGMNERQVSFWQIPTLPKTLKCN